MTTKTQTMIGGRQLFPVIHGGIPQCFLITVSFLILALATVTTLLHVMFLLEESGQPEQSR